MRGRRLSGSWKRLLVDSRFPRSPLAASLVASLLVPVGLLWLALGSVSPMAVHLEERAGELFVSDVAVAERAWLVGVRPGMMVEGIQPAEAGAAGRWETLAVTDGFVHITLQRTYPSPDVAWLALSLVALLAAAGCSVIAPSLAWSILLIPWSVAVLVGSDFMPAMVGAALVLTPPLLGLLSLLEGQRRPRRPGLLFALMLCLIPSAYWMVTYAGRADSWTAQRLIAVVVGYALVSFGTFMVLRTGMTVVRARHRSASVGRGPAVSWVIGTVDELIPGRSSTRLAAIERERASLATDLHGDVLPRLASVIRAVESGVNPVDAAASLRALANDLRDLSSDRRLSILEDGGLIPALEWFAERVEARSGVSVRLEVAGDSDRPPGEVELHAFRIAQQAIENSIVHATPREILVYVKTAKDQLHLQVVDDGPGIVAGAEEAAARVGRLGVHDMRQRAESIGADLSISRSDPNGTVVDLLWRM